MRAAGFRVLSAVVVGGLFGLLAFGITLLATDDQTWSTAIGAAAFAVGVALSAMVNAPVDHPDRDRRTKEK